MAQTKQAKKIQIELGRNTNKKKLGSKELKIEGHGFFVEHKHQLKGSNKFSPSFGKTRTTKSFRTENEAISHAKQFQDGKSIVNILDGTNIINIKKVGAINLHGKFSEGV